MLNMQGGSVLIEASNDISLKNQNIISLNLGAIKVVQDGIPFQEFPLHKVYYPDLIVTTLIKIRNLYRENLTLLSHNYEKKSKGAVLQRSCLDLIPSFFDVREAELQEVIMAKVLRFENPCIMDKSAFKLNPTLVENIGIFGLEVRQSKFTLSNKEHSYFLLSKKVSCDKNELPVIQDDSSKVFYSYMDRIYLNDNDERGYSLGHRFFTPCVNTKNLGAYGGVVRSEIVIDSN